MAPMPATTTTTLEPLARLADDVAVSAWLLPAADPLRGYVEMLAGLPPTPEAWGEVLWPWLDAARRGHGPSLDEPGRKAVAGALGVAALRAVRDLPHDAVIAPTLRAAARWCFFLVRPDAH
jgi:hypothetical protein